MSDQFAERQRVYDQHWRELIEIVRAWRPEIAEQLSSVAVLRFVNFAEDAGAEIPVTNSDFAEFKRPSDAIFAVLKSLGGRATLREVCATGVAGGYGSNSPDPWKNPYRELRESLRHVATHPKELKKGERKFRVIGDIAELIGEE